MSSVLFLDPRGTAAEVIRAAIEHGHKVVVLLSDPDLLGPETRRLCHSVAEVPSWRDETTVLRAVDQILGTQRDVGVYFNTDAAAALGHRLRASYNLPHVDPDRIDGILDKGRLRAQLRNAGLSRLRSLSETDMSSLSSWPFVGAAYFKPRHGCASALVERVTSLAELTATRANAKERLSTTPRWVRNYIGWDDASFLLEEEIRGELLSVEAFSSGGTIHILGLLSRILFSRNPIIEMGSCFPYPHPRAEEIIAFVKRAHDHLGFGDGPSHIEVIVGEDGSFELIDFNPRIVGADVLWSINHAYGIRLEQQLLAWALGRAPKIELRKSKFACLQYVLPPAALTFTSIDLPMQPDVPYRNCFVRPGTRISSTEQQTDYLGCYLTVAPTFEGALQRSKELRAAVRINGTLPGAF